jgi:hypothetical protein
VQIAKALEANVTGVCSTGNVEMVRSIGADSVVDYTAKDFTRQGERYDLILDAVGNRSLNDPRRALTPKGTLVIVGAAGGEWVGPFALALKAALVSRFGGQRLVFFMAKICREDLLVLTEFVAAGIAHAGHRPHVRAGCRRRGHRLSRGGTRPRQGSRHALNRTQGTGPICSANRLCKARNLSEGTHSPSSELVSEGT